MLKGRKKIVRWNHNLIPGDHWSHAIQHHTSLTINFAMKSMFGDHCLETTLWMVIHKFQQQISDNKPTNEERYGWYICLFIRAWLIIRGDGFHAVRANNHTHWPPWVSRCCERGFVCRRWPKLPELFRSSSSLEVPLIRDGDLILPTLTDLAIAFSWAWSLPSALSPQWYAVPAISSRIL